MSPINRRDILFGIAGLLVWPDFANAGDAPLPSIELPFLINLESPPDNSRRVFNRSFHSSLRSALKSRSNYPLPTNASCGCKSSTTSTSEQPGSYEGYKIQWANDTESVDFRHLLGAENIILGRLTKPHEQFELTAAILAQICRNNSFVPLGRHKQPKVLFGIRGATLVGPNAAWSEKVTLQIAQPDHLNLSCVLGVWDRSNPEFEVISVFPGSTVPHALYMKTQFEGGFNSNMMPTGLHRFYVGTHEGMLGAFKQGTPYPPHRIPHRLGESHASRVLCFTNEVTKFSRPNLYESHGISSCGNDIHMARTPRPKLSFSSAGCQVVRGAQFQNCPDPGHQHACGDWRLFRIFAGLADPPQNVRNGMQIDYLLMSGREVLLTSRAQADQMRLLQRFRFGSIALATQNERTALLNGQTVRDLQHALRNKCRQPQFNFGEFSGCVRPSDFGSDAKFFGGTMREVLAYQAHNRGYADGIVDSDLMHELTAT